MYACGSGQSDGLVHENNKIIVMRNKGFIFNIIKLNLVKLVKFEKKPENFVNWLKDKKTVILNK
jgi:hypothetical protein